ncbi:hypothetical protein CCHR01_19434 [Colletotrichum chrysophilum]|uniref:Uncharacterized protein n=1 Tax=Colletotrichum chrysophilum TaxID=1836956 RepID=A0AAD9E552_9PEZI|nr:hypothetical protein CCHR01_19434 [Colletotrichum chrysophilum]
MNLVAPCCSSTATGGCAWSDSMASCAIGIAMFGGCVLCANRPAGTSISARHLCAWSLQDL